MSFVHVDRHSGVVLRAESALEASWSARLMTLRYPLHIGALGGLATRLLAVLTGLVPAGLFPAVRPASALIPSKEGTG